MFKKKQKSVEIFPDDKVYKTKKLFVCDVRTIICRFGNLCRISNEPKITACLLDKNSNYIDVFTNEVYSMKMDGNPGDKFVISANTFTKEIIKSKPYMTLLEIGVELSFPGSYTEKDDEYDEYDEEDEYDEDFDDSDIKFDIDLRK